MEEQCIASLAHNVTQERASRQTQEIKQDYVKQYHCINSYVIRGFWESEAPSTQNVLKQQFMVEKINYTNTVYC